MPEIIRITSEALQQTIRRLLPSQQGFGEDLQASNVITPIIDLTRTAEGSELPGALQTAFDSTQTTAEFSNSTTALISATGFVKVFLEAFNNSAAVQVATFQLQPASGGPVKVFDVGVPANDAVILPNLYFYVQSGDTLQGVSPSGTLFVRTSTRQVADLYGNLTNPSGFTPQ